jgi:hypothetical protein
MQILRVISTVHFVGTLNQWSFRQDMKVNTGYDWFIHIVWIVRMNNRATVRFANVKVILF